MTNFKTSLLATAVSFMAFGAYAGESSGNWTLDPALSNVSFGSIKNDYVGESHSFGDISGSVSKDGAVDIKLDLLSVETKIDIRNERMVEHVFKDATSATISAQLDMAPLLELPAGQATTVETTGTLDLLGTQTDLDAVFFVMRLNDEQVMVTTDSLLMLSTEDAGIDAGINVLQELAGLDSITRVSPVGMRLVFNAGS